MSLRQVVSRVKDSGFARAVGVLVGGTAIAHAITAGALPIVTRLYTPEDFTVLAVFSAVMSILAVAMCLRYDVAIPLPESDEDGANLLALAIGVSFAIAAAIGVLVWMAPGWVARSMGRPAVEPHLWLLPIALLLAGAYSAMQFWLVRRKRFPTLARMRVMQSVAASGTQIGMGLAHLTPLGLLLGQTINSGAACLGVVGQIMRADRTLLRAVNLARVRELARSYGQFPKFSAAEALANSASIQLPLLLIAILATGPEAGHVVLAMFVMQAPMALIGSAVSQVYLSRAADEHRAGRLAGFTVTVISGLARVGVGPLVFAGLVAPFLFEPVFGPDWQRAGVLVAWMTPWFVVHFIAAPVSMALHVTGQQPMALALQAGGLAVRTTAVAIAGALPGAFVSEAYAVSGVVFYAAYLAVVVHAVGARMVEIRRALQQALLPSAAWAAGAIALAIALGKVWQPL
ncbi:MAG: oligosaccharide flippase family protein [Pseudomonadota bacterium]